MKFIDCHARTRTGPVTGLGLGLERPGGCLSLVLIVPFDTSVTEKTIIIVANFRDHTIQVYHNS